MTETRATYDEQETQRPTRVFIAGPYRAKTEQQRDANIHAAREVAAELLRRGHYVFCPHANTAHFDDDYPDIPDQAYLDTCLAWLGVADAILLLPGWESSEGARGEYAQALKQGIVIFERIDDVPYAGKREVKP